MDKNQFWGKGIKRTKQRESVLSVLSEAEKPLTAMEIYTETEKMDSAIWLSTIYRVLEFFALKGIVNKIVFAGDAVASYEINTNEHRHYAVCIACHKIIALDNCPIKQAVSLNDFHVTGHKLEIFGYCDKCY